MDRDRYLQIQHLAEKLVHSRASDVFQFYGRFGLKYKVIGKWKTHVSGTVFLPR